MLVPLELFMQRKIRTNAPRAETNTYQCTESIKIHTNMIGMLVESGKTK